MIRTTVAALSLSLIALSPAYGKGCLKGAA